MILWFLIRFRRIGSYADLVEVMDRVDCRLITGSSGPRCAAAESNVSETRTELHWKTWNFGRILNVYPRRRHADEDPKMGQQLGTEDSKVFSRKRPGLQRAPRWTCQSKTAAWS